MPRFIRPPVIVKSVPTVSTTSATDFFGQLAPVNHVVNLDAVQALHREMIGAGHIEQFTTDIGLHPNDVLPDNESHVSVPALAFFLEGGESEIWYFCGPERTLAEWAAVRDKVEQAVFDNSYYHEIEA